MCSELLCTGQIWEFCAQRPLETLSSCIISERNVRLKTQAGKKKTLNVNIHLRQNRNFHRGTTLPVLVELLFSLNVRNPEKSTKKTTLVMSLPVSFLQVRCGGSGRWFRPLRATAGPARPRWSSGSPVRSDPATAGSTAPGPSVGWRCVNEPRRLIINDCIDLRQQDAASTGRRLG